MIVCSRMKGDVNLRYIGSKNLLLEEIEQLLDKHIIGNEKTFLDLFAGTNVVGEYFKARYTVYSNDILYFSYVNAKAVIENNKPLTFSKLKKINIKDPFKYLEDKKNIRKYNGSNYYEKNYTPSGNAMYFTEENGKKIDFIRDTIDEWNKKDLLNEYEYYYLVSCLIEAIPFISNTTGTYGAFLKHWDNRALNPLEFHPLKVINNYTENKAYNEDSNKLIKEIKTDIVYIDTPYNNRQYASNYHVLENIARNDKPELKGVTKLFDWSDLKSDYSTKRNAYSAMEDLIKNINSKHIILSYNDEGIIPIDELIKLLKKYSSNKKIDIVEIDYQKYNSKIKSRKKGVTEYLFYISKERKIKNTEQLVTKTDKWVPKKRKYIKSPLNYVGGKYKLLDQIIPLFPNDINNFLDLFSGGANVGINIDANKNIFNDMNYKINEVFRYFAENDSEEVIKKIENKIQNYNLSKTNKEGFLKFREDYNNEPNPLDLYTLVCYSYNYQFRFNNSLKYNNPFGKNRSSFSKNMRKNLIQFSDKLDDMNHEFTDEYFTDIDYTFLGKNDFVYLDPPYLITNGSYNDGNRGFKDWDEEQELAMYELMDYLTDKEVRFALSNVLEHKGVKNKMLEEYLKDKDYNVYDLNYTYRNSSHNTKQKDSREVLITNYDSVNFKV